MHTRLYGLLPSMCISLVALGLAACGEVKPNSGSDEPDAAGAQVDGGGSDPADSGGADDEPDAGDPGDAGESDAGPPVIPENPGDLIITEIHKDPAAVLDEDGEWFEIHNPTESTFDLTNIILTDESEPKPESFNLPDRIIIPPRGFLVLARSDDEATNGGVDADIVYGVGEILFQLMNEADEIIIMGAGDVVLDRVAYDGTFPSTSGRSLSLDPALHTDEDNDAEASWCDGEIAYGDGDFGTPGSLNPPCEP
jgi:Lamin Tail Domain